jgi:hypothetical protein
MTNLRRLFVLCLLLSMTLIATAQIETGTLEGTVVTVANGQTIALRGATVTLTGTGVVPQVQVSNAMGQFRFLSLSPGTYQTKAQLAGFTDATAPATIAVGKNTTQTLTLQPIVESKKKKG